MQSRPALGPTAPISTGLSSRIGQGLIHAIRSNWIEVLGYVGAFLTLATYSMKTMIPLRVVGLCANVIFIAYGWLAPVYPQLLLHGALLPLNAVYYTIAQIRQPWPDVSLLICGESFSNEQGWIEGALTSAEHIMQDKFGLRWPSWPPSGYYLGP